MGGRGKRSKQASKQASNQASTHATEDAVPEFRSEQYTNKEREVRGRKWAEIGTSKLPLAPRVEAPDDTTIKPDVPLRKDKQQQHHHHQQQQRQRQTSKHGRTEAGWANNEMLSNATTNTSQLDQQHITYFIHAYQLVAPVATLIWPVEPEFAVPVRSVIAPLVC